MGRGSVMGRTYAGLPRWLYVPAAFGALLVILPLFALTLRLDWSRFFELITSESSVAALQLSLQTSVASTVVCVLLGVPLAMVLARDRFAGQALLRSVVLLPLVLPPVVGGIALLYTFGRRGLLGPAMDVLGVQIAFSTIAVVRRTRRDSNSGRWRGVVGRTDEMRRRDGRPSLDSGGIFGVSGRCDTATSL